MAVSLTTETYTQYGQSSTTKTISHDAGTDANRPLLVYVLCQAGNTVTGITYNSVALTLMQSYVFNGSPNAYAYKLASPASGINDLVITYSSAGYTESSCLIQSFAGATLGVDEIVSTMTSNPSDSITTTATGIVFNQGYNTFYGSSPTCSVDSVNSTEKTIATLYAGGIIRTWYSAELTAGTHNITTSWSSQGTLHTVEIQNAGSTPAITSKMTQAIWF